jgi:hypothetical protein
MFCDAFCVMAKRPMTRAAATDAAARTIARSVPNLVDLIWLLEMAGITRLAEAVREHTCPAPVTGDDGIPKPDPRLWSRGKL